MKNSIRKELKQHVIDTLNDTYDVDETNFEELHNIAFNQDYYIIYHSEALKWLELHDIGQFEAINEVQEYEIDNFSKSSTDVNPEAIVNMYVYIQSEELINEIEIDDLADSNINDMLAAVNNL